MAKSTTASAATPAYQAANYGAKAPKPAIVIGGTSVHLGTKAPTRRGNQGGKG